MNPWDEINAIEEDSRQYRDEMIRQDIAMQQYQNHRANHWHPLDPEFEEDDDEFEEGSLEEEDDFKE